MSGRVSDCWGCGHPILEGKPHRMFNYGHALEGDGFSIHHVCETAARARLLDLLVMDTEGWKEVSVEWANQIRASLPKDFDYGCGCPSCTITRGLNHFCGATPDRATPTEENTG